MTNGIEVNISGRLFTLYEHYQTEPWKDVQVGYGVICGSALLTHSHDSAQIAMKSALEILRTERALEILQERWARDHQT